MTVDLLERPRPADADILRRPQFRLSDDGIAWTPWRVLISIELQIPAYGYVQVRVWKGRDWELSPMFSAIPVEE